MTFVKQNVDFMELNCRLRINFYRLFLPQRVREERSNPFSRNRNLPKINHIGDQIFYNPQKDHFDFIFKWQPGPLKSGPSTTLKTIISQPVIQSINL